ncbi:hypothetical protein N657DRAFT_694197 [Parathielavia appendiculata]|uniref:Zn(2)-C6 fungal-type domain-containing protein n=1 Tax=Parathielavia appendiculata TaxID=2587402 RepID=A0AAN6YZV0_9PEZI|nr:hypothetical protein N657DRAFT_694197 [Parathielavia appendiculata]
MTIPIPNMESAPSQFARANAECAMDGQCTSFHSTELPPIPAVSVTIADGAGIVVARSGPPKRRRVSETARASSPSTTSVSPPTAAGEARPLAPPARRKAKVSRACDECKSRKAKCSGTEPCETCHRKGRVCHYLAEYSRGRPPTPPPMPMPVPTVPAGRPSSAQSGGGLMTSMVPPGQSRRRTRPVAPELAEQHEGGGLPPDCGRQRLQDSRIPSSRASPVLGVAEIQGQVHDPTSGLAFLHRAWKRLSRANGPLPSEGGAGMAPQAGNLSLDEQPIFAAGDRPLPSDDIEDAGVGDGADARSWFPNPARARELLALYFDVCIATYRVLHRPTVESWLKVVESNLAQSRPIYNGIGRAKVTILLTALAIATTHHEKSRGFSTAEDEAQSLARSDRLFSEGARLTREEKGLPRLESAQARLVQVLYLLTTSRVNRGWYVFGEALQIISALGLHRAVSRKLQLASGNQNVDYIQSQCRKRTFWAAYILDHYLGIILGRPRHYHDEDIDQDFPDAINDEDMRADASSSRVNNNVDSHLEALIFHAKIAQIIGKITREVYTIRAISEQERVSAAHRLCEELHSWQASLPPHLGAVRPSSLIPSFRRQCIVLRIAYSHAVMHANRFFLLGNLSSRSEMQVAECVMAAKTVLEIVDGLARDSPIFHAFWWTHYVAFCALVVTYAWEIRQHTQNDSTGTKSPPVDRTLLLDLAERCQTHLAQATATNSPSRRYAIILEELRSEAQWRSGRGSGMAAGGAGRQHNGVADHSAGVPGNQPARPFDVEHMGDMDVHEFQPAMFDAVDGFGTLPGNPIFETWNMTDWLELDSSAFGPYISFDEPSISWLPGPVAS